MRISKYPIYLLAALILVLLDVSFFSNLEIYGATLLFSFITLVIMAISSKNDDFIFYGFTLSILFTVFSSLPLPVIAINFVLLPAVINFVMKKYFPSPNTVTSVFYFLFANFLFEFVLLVWSKEWNVFGFTAVAAFTVINTIFGVFAYYLFNRAKKRILADFEIKI